MARDRRPRDAGTEGGSPGRSWGGGGWQAGATRTRREALEPFRTGAGIAKDRRRRDLRWLSRRCDPRRPPPRADDARDRQSRGPSAGAPRSPRGEALEADAAGAGPGPRPLALPPRRPPAGNRTRSSRQVTGTCPTASSSPRRQSKRASTSPPRSCSPRSRPGHRWFSASAAPTVTRSLTTAPMFVGSIYSRPRTTARQRRRTRPNWRFPTPSKSCRPRGIGWPS